MRHLFYYFLLVQLAVINADPYICEKSVTIDPPNDINNPWLYPNGYDGKGDAPRFAPNQNCTWKFNVPKGMYAVMEITASTNETTLNVVNSNGNIRWMSVNVYQDPYYVLDPGFSVNLEAASSGTLGMKVVWSKVGTFNPQAYNVVPGDTPWVISSGAFDAGLVVSSATQVSLVSLPPPPNFEQLKPYMRNTVVFDGPTINDKFIGNLWEIWDSGNQVVSTGNSLTLFALVPNIQLNDYILLQDYDNVKQFSIYRGVSCFSETACVVTIQAEDKPAAAVKMSATPHYLRGINTARSDDLTVYTGSIQSSNLIASYPYSKTYPSLPQKFTGLFTTYVFSSGIGVAYITPDDTDFSWSNVSDGRTGFVTSKNYGVSSVDQGIFEPFTALTTSTFTVTVKESGLVGTATMQITVTDGQNMVLDEKYNSNHLPTSPISVNGTSLTIKYDTNGAETKGAYVNFAVKNAFPGQLTSTVTSIPPVSSTTPSTTTKGALVRSSTNPPPVSTTTNPSNSTSTAPSTVSNTSTSTSTSPAHITNSVPITSTNSVPNVSYSTTRIIPSRPTSQSVETTTKVSSRSSIIFLISGFLLHYAL